MNARGFSLAEICIALAIAGILCAMAAPGLMSTYVRAQLRTVMSDLAPVRADVAQATACTPNQDLPAMTLAQLPHFTYSIAANPCASSLPYTQGEPWGRYVGSLTFDGTNLRATLGPEALPVLRGGVLTLTNAAASGAPAWRCSFSIPPYGALLGC